MIPNAGYVFGGAMLPDGRVRGFDCSAFLSVATSSSVRLSTGVMEYAWREMHGDSFDADDPDGAIRADMRAHYGLREAEAEYEPIVATIDELQPGDLIVWRYPQKYPTASGHTAMFVGRTVPGGAPGEFLGIEATRADDKSKEGLIVRGFDMEHADAFNYVLRRRGH
jgi:cell wall-associated NlpC family hydrolase